MNMTAYTFRSRHDAQEFANLKSMVDAHKASGPFIYGEKFVVYLVGANA